MIFSQLLIVGACFLGHAGGSASTSKEDIASMVGSLGSACPSPEISSGSADRVFEGVEKRIEIRFDVPTEDPAGLRAIPRVELDDICEASKCTIIHSEPDTCFDSYILSESSLFVFRDRIMIKTCGTTLPLNGVEPILASARQLNLKPLDMTYSRSSFVFPDLQLFPHDSLGNEREYLSAMSEDLGPVLSEKTEILGSEDGIFWLVHTKNFASDKVVKSDPRIMVDCIMTGLSAESRASFWKDSRHCDETNSAAMSAVIQSFDESFRVVGKAFDPCGFSANVHGDNNEDYLSVHVTPEEGFSYASVEGVFGGTIDEERLNLFVQRVVNVFRPERLLVTVLSTGDNSFTHFGSIMDNGSMYELKSLGSVPVSGDAEVSASAALYSK